MCILASAASYYRFMVSYDYLVYDEVECDPYTESCFVWCEDDECLEPFYYAMMERQASDLVEFCDGDNTDCDAAYWCEPDETTCTITYCDPVLDEGFCDDLSESEVLDE